MRRRDLVGLVDAAPGAMRTLTATERHWMHRDRAERAVSWEYDATDAPEPASGRAEALEILSAVAYAAPHRARAVTATEFGPGDVVESVEILNGTRRWTGFDGRYVEQVLPEPFLRGNLGALLQPGYLLGALVLDHPVDDVVQGRPCVRVDARRRPGGTAGLAGAGGTGAYLIADNADHRLWFDAAHGIALRHEVLVGGRPAIVTELLDLVVDRPLPDDLFVPPPGAAIQAEADFAAELRRVEGQGR